MSSWSRCMVSDDIDEAGLGLGFTYQDLNGAMVFV